jgi:(p)ppGpp synthase/HD superfamily hydrolase
MKLFTTDTAIQFAVRAHFGQRDRAGQPYIKHPIRVAMAQENEIAFKVGVLHDTIEDSKGLITFDHLIEAGAPEEVVEPLKLLTHETGISTADYMASIRAIKLNPTATAVKLADLKDNLDITRLRGRREGLTEKDMARLAKYYEAWTILKGDGL